MLVILFLLLAVDVGLIFWNRRRAAIWLWGITCMLMIYTLAHHITQKLPLAF